MHAAVVVDATFYLVIVCCRGGSDQTTLSSSDLAASVKRAHDARDAGDAQAAAVDAADFSKAQDDSVVYSETPSKKHGAKLKSQRRGESFK